eukprot:142225-Chlamydomonas_euryale.AAC.1
MGIGVMAFRKIPLRSPTLHMVPTLQQPPSLHRRLVDRLSGGPHLAGRGFVWIPLQTLQRLLHPGHAPKAALVVPAVLVQPHAVLEQLQDRRPEQTCA